MTDLVGKTVRLPPELWEQLAARAERTDRSVNYEIIQAVCAHVVKVVPDVGKLVSGQYQSGTKVVPERCTPDPSPPPAEPPDQDPDQKKKDQDQKEQDRKGDARGKPDLNAITSRVIAWINEIRPAKRGFEAKTYRPDVGRLLKRGHKESELIEVVEWRAEECRRTGDWLWFKPGTLFRVTEFAKRLDEARAGVEHGKESSRRGQRDLYETPDATDAIWMKGVDNA